MNKIKKLYKETYFLRLWFIGLILFNLIMRYGSYFIDLLNKFYDYIGL